MPPDESQELPLDKYSDDLRNEARRILRSQRLGFADVSDLVQATFVRALEKRHQFQGETEGQFFAWLRSILGRLINDKLRKFGRRGDRKTKSLHQAQDDSSSRCIPEPESDESSPSQKCAREEESSLMRKALDELPEAQRTAVKMKHFDGLDVPEIARRMGTTPAAVASLLYRGRKALLEQMGQGTNDGER